MERTQLSRAWIVGRMVALSALLALVTLVPVRGTEASCEACVWDWNGSGYVASCQESSSGGVSGCIVGEGTHPEHGEHWCYIGDPCDVEQQ